MVYDEPRARSDRGALQDLPENCQETIARATLDHNKWGILTRLDRWEGKVSFRSSSAVSALVAACSSASGVGQTYQPLRIGEKVPQH
jgi:hypothetical protein